jgi:hypothetical protein
MKTSLLALLHILAGLHSLFAQVADPMRDYLSMDVPDRHEFLDRYSTIYRAKCDVDGDGKDEVLIGTVYDQSGNKTIYWTLYAPSGSQFNRISSASVDIPIALRDAFIGRVEEEGKEGLLVVDEPVKNEFREATAWQKVMFFYIEDGTLRQKALLPLDLRVAGDDAFYEKYFGEHRESRPLVIESMTAEELVAAGYDIPSWEPVSQ